MVKSIFTLSALLSIASAATLWDGRFNDISTASDLGDWSWSNEVGSYQWYIHGSGPITEYLNLSPSNKNPADTVSKQGIKMTIDDTSYWNGQTMRRTELIPQTSAAINQGKVWYHFSMKISATNAPSTALEHQINFFESHFTEMKYGLLSGASGTSDPTLKWMVNSVTQWSATLDADTWHNVAYEIDFSANTVGFWHSTGSADLTEVVKPMSVSTSSNGEDWHLGVLRLPGSSSLTSPDVEDWYFSGVYIESGSLTTSVTGGASSASGSSGSSASSSSAAPAPASSPAASSPAASTTFTTSKAAAPTATAPASGGSIAKYAQCGGTNWTGSGSCVSGSTCVVLNPYYSQCQ